MQLLVEDMQTVTEGLETVCNEMTSWECEKLFQKIQELLEPVTTLISIVFNNKALLEGLSINIRETEISACLGEMMNGLEQRDEVAMLDSMYYGLLPWFREMIEGMSAILKQQEEQ